MCCMKQLSSDALKVAHTFAALPSDAHSVGFVKYRSDQWEMNNSTSLNHLAHAGI